jgi:hypothetical protein
MQEEQNVSVIAGSLLGEKEKTDRLKIVMQALPLFQENSGEDPSGASETRGTDRHRKLRAAKGAGTTPGGRDVSNAQLMSQGRH